MQGRFGRGEVKGSAHREEIRKLLGAWSAVSGEADGKRLRKKQLEGNSVTFTDDGLQIAPFRMEFALSPIEPNPDALDASDEVWPFRIDSTQKPKWLDIQVGESDVKGDGAKPIYMQCLYAREGDSLVINWGWLQRPTSFETKSGDGFTTITYRRVRARKR